MANGGSERVTIGAHCPTGRTSGAELLGVISLLFLEVSSFGKDAVVEEHSVGCDQNSRTGIRCNPFSGYRDLSIIRGERLLCPSGLLDVMFSSYHILSRGSFAWIGEVIHVVDASVLTSSSRGWTVSRRSPVLRLRILGFIPILLSTALLRTCFLFSILVCQHGHCCLHLTRKFRDVCVNLG